MRPDKNEPTTTRTDKRRYQPPVLRELGNVREITKALPSGPDVDFGGRRN